MNQNLLFSNSLTLSFFSPQIRIHDTTVPVFLAFLEYIYSDQIPEDVSITLYKELLVVADRFCLPRLINLCEQALCQQVGNELRMKPIPQPVCNQLIELLLFSQASSQHACIAGTHNIIFGWGCATRSWKPLPYFRPKYTIFHTLFQT